MSSAEFKEYEKRESGLHVIDLVTEELTENLKHDLCTCLLRLADIVEKRYDTSCSDDRSLLVKVDACTQEIDPSQPRKRNASCKANEDELEKALTGGGVRLENLRNVLILRIGQKQILEELRAHSRACFEGGESEESDDGRGSDTSDTIATRSDKLLQTERPAT